MIQLSLCCGVVVEYETTEARVPRASFCSSRVAQSRQRRAEQIGSLLFAMSSSLSLPVTSFRSQLTVTLNQPALSHVEG